MPTSARGADYALQHLIDPEVCIRCNTCEATCPVHAISHDSRNYVVDFSLCGGCHACVAPCPTGAIDHWHQVPKSTPYTTDEQLAWDALPPPVELEAEAPGEVPAEVRALTEIATAGQGGPATPPWSAAHPYVNLYSSAKPAIAKVTGNYRLTADDASADIRHLVLDFGTTAFPLLEGQTLGIVPPGTDAKGRPHALRLYSVASPRDGERPHYNNVALTVKRVTADHDGRPVHGVASNYLCDLGIGDTVSVVGPYGTSFLTPNHPGSSLMMICTGTGSAPMRAMTERRRRRRALNEGGELVLFFGARAEHELPYFGPLMKLPKDFIDINFAFSRVPGEPKRYVQDRIRERGDKVARMLMDDDCYIYLCGLKDMEEGVTEAFRDVCRRHELDWDRLKPELLAKSRLHIETY
ncbi:MAG: benzoyl-CoA 2,3-epoxidase subunit BoxA [Proteobacteria bacterium]|jgi:benzoyl-CoA 2,3-dioxygenase component A|nr:benzoyl-CoA 2,3-epoxidase subunit BoxA [Pseudomonadota bacterium]